MIVKQNIVYHLEKRTAAQSPFGDSMDANVVDAIKHTY
jgi:hypothetical protein